jgi:hypothetical protein
MNLKEIITKHIMSNGLDIFMSEPILKKSESSRKGKPIGISEYNPLSNRTVSHIVDNKIVETTVKSLEELESLVGVSEYHIEKVKKSLAIQNWKEGDQIIEHIKYSVMARNFDVSEDTYNRTKIPIHINPEDIQELEFYLSPGDDNDASVDVKFTHESYDCEVCIY